MLVGNSSHINAELNLKPSLGFRGGGVCDNRDLDNWEIPKRAKAASRTIWLLETREAGFARTRNLCAAESVASKMPDYCVRYYN